MQMSDTTTPPPPPEKKKEKKKEEKNIQRWPGNNQKVMSSFDG